MSKAANKLRSHIRINNEWGRVVEGQTDDMARAADLLDEAEKALEEIGARQLFNINKTDGEERGFDAIAATVLYEELGRVRRLARTTLARIRGEKA